MANYTSDAGRIELLSRITSITLVGKEPKDMLRIPYIIDGTEFDGSFYVENFNPDTYLDDLEVLQKKQDIFSLGLFIWKDNSLTFLCLFYISTVVFDFFLCRTAI